MSFFSKISFKIIIIEFLTLLIAGIGVFIIISRSKDVLNDYNDFYYDNVRNKSVINLVENLVRKEQNITAGCLFADEHSSENIFIQQRNMNHEDLYSALNELQSIMDKREEKITFAQLHISCKKRISDGDKALELKKSKGKTEALKYFSDLQRDYDISLNSYIQKLTIAFDNEIEIKRSLIKANRKFLIIFFICVASIICLFIAVSVFLILKLGYKLEKQRDNLEVEVSNKAKEVIEKTSRLIEFQQDTIYGMANLIELRNGETGEHVKRTSQYVNLISRELQKKNLYPDILNDKYIDLLVKAAPMHDVGKIITPDSILTKPGKLTAEEFEIIKKHAAEGGRIVKEVLGKVEDPEYVDIASKVASYHHEKWNGAGYPEKLAGEQIPLCARIMAIADVFDALVSYRCYKNPMSVDTAMGIIKDSSGSHFDPVLVDVFLELRPEIEKILNS